jgi:hypothetical protein
LEGRQIHEVIGSAQEGLHTIKTKNMHGMVVKLDLSKAYDMTCWLYLRLVLIHVGVCLLVVNWIMGCVTSVSLAVLINGASSSFFRISRGLIQGVHYHLTYFCWWQKGSVGPFWKQKEAEYYKVYEWEVMNLLPIYYLWMMSFFFPMGSVEKGRKMHEILQLYCKATGMEVNYLNSAIYFNELGDMDEKQLKVLFPFKNVLFQDGLKYLGFNIKPNGYGKNDWTWLL